MMRNRLRLQMVIIGIAAFYQLAAGAAPAIGAAGTHMVPVLAQPIMRGEIIRPENVVMQEMKRSPAGIDYITSGGALTGMSAKRPLRAGVALRSTDITEPKVIMKGDLVTIAFEAPGLSLSIRGKALEDGVLAQTIRVMNTQTSRTLEGVVSGAGYVLVSPAIAPAPAAGQPQTSRLEYSSTAAVNHGQ